MKCNLMAHCGSKQERELTSYDRIIGCCISIQLRPSQDKKGFKLYLSESIGWIQLPKCNLKKKRLKWENFKKLINFKFLSRATYHKYLEILLGVNYPCLSGREFWSGPIATLLERMQRAKLETDNFKYFQLELFAFKYLFSLFLKYFQLHVNWKISVKSEFLN